MKYFHIICVLVVISGLFGYEHYRLLSLKKNFDQLLKQSNQQEIIYNNKIKNLEDDLHNQSVEIESMKFYVNGISDLNGNISKIKKEYSQTKHTAKEITQFQNNLFDKFGE